MASCNAVMIAMERAAEWQMALNLLDLMGKMQVGCVGHPTFRDLFNVAEVSVSWNGRSQIIIRHSFETPLGPPEDHPQLARW